MSLEDVGDSLHRNYEPNCWDNEFWWDYVWYPDYNENWTESGDFFAVTQDPVFDWWTADSFCHEWGGRLAHIKSEEDS